MHVILSKSSLVSLREATAKGNTLSELTKIIRQGWPKLKHNVPLTIQTVWPYRDELVMDGNIVFKEQK